MDEKTINLDQSAVKDAVIKQAEIKDAFPTEIKNDVQDETSKDVLPVVAETRPELVSFSAIKAPPLSDEEFFIPKKRRRSRLKSAAAMFCSICLLGVSVGAGVGIGVPIANNYFLPRLLDDSANKSAYNPDNSSKNYDAAGVSSLDPSNLPSSSVFPFSYADLVNAVKPSVVSINTVITGQQQYFNRLVPYQAEGAGTGVIFYETDKNYYIITNAHVIVDAINVTVSIDGSKEIKASLVGKNVKSDLAVISVSKGDAQKAGIYSAVIAELGDSSAMQVGDIVLAIGNSLGEGIVVTDGIVSGLDRNVTLEGNINLDVLQTNAAINQGNSGGPLFNLNGEVIGINTAKASQSSSVSIEGTGYAIPSNIVKQVIQEIMSGEGTNEAVETATPKLGITGGDITDEIAQTYGVPKQGAYVSEVNEGEAADKAGILPNDIITAVNDEPVGSFSDLRLAIMAHKPGDELVLTIIRNGSELVELTVVLDAGF